jgi:hypothetical protein
MSFIESVPRRAPPFLYSSIFALDSTSAHLPLRCLTYNFGCLITEMASATRLVGIAVITEGGRALTLDVVRTGSGELRIIEPAEPPARAVAVASLAPSTSPSPASPQSPFVTSPELALALAPSPAGPSPMAATVDWTESLESVSVETLFGASPAQ